MSDFTNLDYVDVIFSEELKKYSQINSDLTSLIMNISDVFPRYVQMKKNLVDLMVNSNLNTSSLVHILSDYKDIISDLNQFNLSIVNLFDGLMKYVEGKNDQVHTTK